jgi:hypothetical protein
MSVLHIWQSMECIVTSFHSECIGWHYGENGKWHGCCYILTMSVNEASTVLDCPWCPIQRAVRRHENIIELSAVFVGKIHCDNMFTMFYKWSSMESQRLLVLHNGICKGCAVMLTHNGTIGHLSRQKLLRHHHFYVLKMSINEASTTSGLVSSTIHRLCGDIQP